VYRGGKRRDERDEREEGPKKEKEGGWGEATDEGGGG